MKRLARASRACACLLWLGAAQAVWLEEAGTRLPRRRRCAEPCCRCSWGRRARPAPGRVRRGHGRGAGSGWATLSPTSSGWSPPHASQLPATGVPRAARTPSHARPQDADRRGAHGRPPRRESASGRGLPRRGVGRARLRAFPAGSSRSSSRPGNFYAAMTAAQVCASILAGCSTRRGRGGRAAGHRVAALRRRLPRRPRLDAPPSDPAEGGFGPAASAPGCARAHGSRHGPRAMRRAPRTRQRAPGRGLRGRAAGRRR